MSCVPQYYSLWVLANTRGIIVKFINVSIFSDIDPSPNSVIGCILCVIKDLVSHCKCKRKYSQLI